MRKYIFVGWARWWVWRGKGRWQVHTLHSNTKNITPNKHPGVQMGLEQRDTRPEHDDHMLKIQVQARGQERRSERQPHDLELEGPAIKDVVAKGDPAAVSWGH